MREPPLPEHIQHDRAIMMTWNIKDSLPARKLVYYGKVLRGRPSFVARGFMQTVKHHSGEYKMASWPVRVDGKTVRLNGAVMQWADVYDLARRIARLPGVERVVLGDIRTGRAPR